MKKVSKRSYIGLLIKKRRRGLKISQEKLGEMIGVSYQQIQKYESGINRVSAEKLRDIASALNIDVGYFYEACLPDGVHHEEKEVYSAIKRLSPDERELVNSFRAIDDMEFRRRFLLLLKRAAEMK